MLSMVRLFLFSTILVFFIQTTSQAQSASLARKYFSDGEFEKAASLYKELHERKATMQDKLQQKQRQQKVATLNNTSRLSKRLR